MDCDIFEENSCINYWCFYLLNPAEQATHPVISVGECYSITPN